MSARIRRSLSHIGDSVLEALVELRDDAAARSVLLGDRSTGLLALVGDPLDLRHRRQVDALLRRGARGRAEWWMWPTIQSNLTILEVAGSYGVALVWSEGPTPMDAALRPHTERLAHRLPSGPSYAARDRADTVDEAAPPETGERPCCSFCRKPRADGGRMISGPEVRICEACVLHCLEALAGVRAPERARDLERQAGRLLDGVERELEQLRFGAAMKGLQSAESALRELLALLSALR